MLLKNTQKKVPVLKDRSLVILQDSGTQCPAFAKLRPAQKCNHQPGAVGHTGMCHSLGCLLSHHGLPKEHNVEQLKQIFIKGKGSWLKSQAAVTHGSPKPGSTQTPLQLASCLPKALQPKPEHHALPQSMPFSFPGLPLAFLPACSKHQLVPCTVLTLPIDAIHLTGPGQENGTLARRHAYAHRRSCDACGRVTFQKGDF